MRNAADNRKPLKPKKCRVCKELFQPFNSLQVVCGVKCAVSKGVDDRLRAAKKVQKDLRADTRKRKKALKSRSDWLREAQAAFNAFIRERDKADPCISCGMYVNDSNLVTGSRWDCGHYLTRGAHPELRFVETNAHKQCTSCNGGSNKYSGKAHTVSTAYRDNLIKKVGLSNVEWLEGAHKAQNLTIDDISDIKDFYKEQLKYIKA